MAVTNKSYSSKWTGSNEADVLDDKFIVLKTIQVTPGTHQHDMHFYGATKTLYLLFGAAIFLLPTFGLVNPTP